MKTQYFTASTLDGFIADEHHSLDWLFQLGDVEDTSYPAFIRDVGALVMGAHTYEWIMAHHIAPNADRPQPWAYAQPTWVMTSRTLPPVSGADIRFARGDVRRVHAAMRDAAGGKNLWIVGGGDLAGQFWDAGLLDEIHVGIASVTLGAGMPVLPRRIDTPPLRLVSVHAVGTAFAELVYEVPRRAP